ncbi:MAG: filamentous hemagglutinin N-terminal domain-containing protein [Alphaproteobacteria bacterium]|nr:filamentous hemagglutinin N-terminal domain-containing protein [Alphaproteobacteria bacterium]
MELNPGLRLKVASQNFDLSTAAVLPRRGTVYSRFRGSVMVSLVAVAALFSGVPKGLAAPVGGVVPANSGTVTIKVKGGDTTVTQTSSRAVIEWSSFNVGASESVTFAVPNNGATLNRVSGLSTISGTVTSNGALYFVSPNGMIFEATSRVSVNSLIVTTADIANANFMAATNSFNSSALNFNRPSSVSSSKITLNGQISTADFGNVVVFGPMVQNSGTISAPRGSVSLSNYGAASLTWQSNGAVIPSKLLKVSELPSVTPVVGGAAKPSDRLLSYVVHDGSISAIGGRVSLTVAVPTTSKGLVDTNSSVFLNSSGTIDASDLLAANTVYAGRVSIQSSANSGTMLISGGTLSAGSGGLLISGNLVNILSTQISATSLSTMDAQGVLTSKDATVSILGMTVTMNGAQISARSRVEGNAHLITGAKSGNATINIIGDDLNFYGNSFDARSEVAITSARMNRLTSGNSLISITGSTIAVSYNSLTTSSTITAQGIGQFYDPRNYQFTSGNSTIAYASNVLSYTSNFYTSSADFITSSSAEVVPSTPASTGLRLGIGQVLHNLNPFVEEPIVIITDEPVIDSFVVSEPTDSVPQAGDGAVNKPTFLSPIVIVHTSVQVLIVSVDGVRTINSNSGIKFESNSSIGMNQPKNSNQTGGNSWLISGENNLSFILQIGGLKSGLGILTPTLKIYPGASGTKYGNAANLQKVALMQQGLVFSDDDQSDGEEGAQQNLLDRLADAYARHFGKTNRPVPLLDPDKVQPGLGFGGTDGVMGYDPNPSINLDFGRGLNQSFPFDEIKLIVPMIPMQSLRLIANPPLDGAAPSQPSNRFYNEQIIEPKMLQPVIQPEVLKLQEIRLETKEIDQSPQDIPSLKFVSQPVPISPNPWLLSSLQQPTTRFES